MEARKINAGPERLISLDAFRGFTIAAMILVNHPGTWSHVYPPLLHAEWHGITPTDLIFPFFIFIVGVSIALSYQKRLDAGVPFAGLYTKTAVRAAKIFAVGIFLALFPDFDFENLRVAGVLQRIAIVFAFCGFLYLKTGWKAQMWIGTGILVAYWLSMTLIPVSGTEKPSLEAGMDLSAWIDQRFLPGRLIGGNWDPEGLFSTLPALVSGITGMLAGRLVVSRISRERIIIWLFSLGFFAMVIGEAWGWIFPINKNLWTSSFVLFTSGLAAMTLAASMFFIDVLGRKKGSSYGIIFGANAITAYVLAGMLSGLFDRIPFWGNTIYGHIVVQLSGAGLDPRMASLVCAVMYLHIIFIPIWVLYRKKLFIRL